MKRIRWNTNFRPGAGVSMAFLAGASLTLAVLAANCSSSNDEGSGAASGSGGTAGGGGASGAGGSTGRDASGGASGTGGAVGGTGGKGGAGGAAGAGGAGATGGASGAGGNAGNASNGDGGPAIDGSVPDGAIDPGPPAVRFVGRFDKSDAAGPKFAWSGSAMIARFSGTSVGVKLTGGQQYTVVVDGAVVKPRFVSTGGMDSLATGLAAGPHQVEVYRRTEANQGDAQFLGFDFGGGTLLSPPLAPNRRIEVLGDSITCGYGDEGADQNCHFTADTENHYLTYEAITARTLSADLITTAWSGKGVVCNYGDDPSSCTDPFPPYYDRTLPGHSTSMWDFSWVPQAVVINLGTNDFSTDQDPSEADFTTAYKALLQHIRSKYAGALILCTVGPLLGGTDLATARQYISEVVTGLGDAKIKTFDLAGVDAADGYGCDWHPSLKTHKKMADQLIAELKTDLGW